MSIPQISESELKMAALSEALTDMLASLSVENLVLRNLLANSGHILPADYDAAMKEFGGAGWQARRNQISEKVGEIAAKALARMKGGRVN